MDLTEDSTNMNSIEQAHQQMIFNLVARISALEKIVFKAILQLSKLECGDETSRMRYADELFRGYVGDTSNVIRETDVERLAVWLKKREGEHLENAMNEIKSLMLEQKE